MSLITEQPTAQDSGTTRRGGLFSWFRPAPHKSRVSEEECRKLYPRYRWQVFESAFIAYATFYIVRNNFAPVSKEIGTALHFDKVMIGNILAATAVAYGVGKLVMGYFADRSDARKYVGVAMLLTAFFNFLFASTSNYTGMLVLWAMNGFVQGMGYGPCTRALAHWYSVKERGTIFGVWNTSHCVGGGAAGVLAAACAQHWGWRSAFYVPGVIATLCAIYLFWRMRDTPQAVGLPQVEEYKNDWPAEEKERHEKELGFREIFLHYILPNRMLWILAFANIFVYIARYAMVDWGPTYLKEVKGASLLSGGFSTLVIEFAGALGMLTMGWVSDKLGGLRARVSAIAMVPLLLAFLGLILSGSLLLTPSSFPSTSRLTQALHAPGTVPAYLWNQIPAKLQTDLDNAPADSEAQARSLAAALNSLLKDDTLYSPGPFSSVSLRDHTKQLLAKKLNGPRAIYANRLLLEDSFPDLIQRSRFTPRGLLTLNLVLFAVIGFFVYVPVMFSGVVALDLTSKKAQATAAGFVGFFGYVGGRVIQGIGIGWLAEHYGWNQALWALMGCIVIGIFLLSLLWNVRPRG
ncbi:MAG TPA: MFS transporter [Verrucomicrobiae bacterium]|nr:MFS transporter [Verrucomicrobiae bacterium]